MDDQNDLFLNRKKLVQVLYGLSGRQLSRFRELFPTPIYDTQIENALNLAMGYPIIDPDPKPKSVVSSTFRGSHQKQWKAQKKMIHR